MLNSLTEENPLFKLIRNSHSSTICALLIVLIGCAGSGLKTEPISLSSDPTEQIQIMAIDLETAKKNQIDILSPRWYKRASLSFNAAKQMHSKGGNLKAIFENLSLAHAQLERAKRLAPVAKIVLVPVSKQRVKALEAGANSGTEGFNAAEEEYLRLTALVEKDDRRKAEKKSGMVKDLFTRVELIAIQGNALNPARKRLKEAKSLNAERLAPRTLKAAENSIASTVNYIKKNRYNSDEIRRKGQVALFLADRSKTIAKEASRIQDESAEATALRMENMTAEIASNLRLPDLRNLPFAVQAETIMEAIDEDNKDWVTLQNETDQKETMAREAAGSSEQELRKVSSKLANEEQRVDVLEKKRKFDELLKSVSKDFSPDEAEIYRQGNNLVFRLKGANFPTGKSTIPSENFSILAKITNSLKQFENARVTVEGHTDSTGLAKTNRELSERRAKAVSDYLIASGATDKEYVQTVGYGYTHPIAPNKTKEGRKINRRIDIIIEPTSE
jgi:OOP family OmpA-OmpF porin